MPTYRTLYGDFVTITGAGSGDMVEADWLATYDPGGVAANIFNTINHSDTVSTIVANTVLVSRTVYNSSSASNLVHTLPDALAGGMVPMFKAGTGQLRMNRAGSDTIEDATSTYIEMTAAGNGYICLYCTVNGLWRIKGGIVGLWSYA